MLGIRADGRLVHVARWESIERAGVTWHRRVREPLVNSAPAPAAPVVSTARVTAEV